MNILEKDIEELLYEACVNNPSILHERGLAIDVLYYNPVVLRQHNLGAYGVMDITLISYEPTFKEYTVYVLELKRDKIDYKTIEQGIRYRKGVEHYFRQFYPKATADINIVLIGKDLDFDSSACYVPDYIPGFSFFTYSLDLISGLTFKNISGYQLTKPDFKQLPKSINDKISAHVADRIRGVVHG